MKPNISRGEQVSARVRWRIRWHVSGNFGYQRDHKLGVMFSSQTYSNQQIDLQFGKGGGYLDDVFNLNSSGHQVKTSKKNHLGKKKSHDPDPRLEVLSPSLYIYIYKNDPFKNRDRIVPMDLHIGINPRVWIFRAKSTTLR